MNAKSKVKFALSTLIINSLLPAFFLYLGLSFGVAVGELDADRVLLASLLVGALCLSPALLLSFFSLRKKPWAKWPTVVLLAFFSLCNLLVFALLVKMLGFFMLSPSFRSALWLAYLSLALPFLPAIAGAIGAWLLAKAKF